MDRLKLLVLRLWSTGPWGTIIAFIFCMAIVLLLLIVFHELSLSPSDAPPAGG